MQGYKGFNPDWTCRDFKFEVGKSYEHKGELSLCNSGFHFCENPLDTFSYYPPTGKFAEVEADNVSDKTGDDSKRVAAKLTVKAEISLHAMIQFGVSYILSKVDFKKAPATNTGYQSAATNTGYQSAATNTGNQSAATNTGYHSAATNTGYQSAATNTGDQSAATNTGYQGCAISLGIGGKASGAIECWLTHAEWRMRDGKWNRINVKTVKVDGKRIKADTFYQLKSGKFVAVK